MVVPGLIVTIDRMIFNTVAELARLIEGAITFGRQDFYNVDGFAHLSSPRFNRIKSGKFVESLKFINEIKERLCPW